MADKDKSILEEAKEAVFSLDKAYRRAVREADLNKMAELKPEIDKAFDKYSQARLKLLESGVLATDNDLAELRRIRAEIDQAATTQSLVLGAVKFTTFIAKFV